MLVSVITGNENFGPGIAGAIHSGSVRVNAFYRSPHSPGKQEPLEFVARHMRDGVQRIGRPDSFAACAINKNLGMWATARYQLPEGSYLQISVTKKMHGNWAAQTKQLMLRMREYAAVRQIVIDFTNNPQASIPSGTIDGRFDIIPPERFADYGILADMPVMVFKQFEFEDDDYEGFFTVNVQEEEVRPLVIPNVAVVETDKGNTVRINKASRRRLIKVRK